MKRIILTLGALAVCASAFAQDDAQKAAAEAAAAFVETPETEAPAPKPKYWKASSVFDLGFNQTYLSSWAAGGFNNGALAAGVDAKAGGHITVGGVRLEATGRYTFQLALDHTDRESLTYGNQIPYIPRHSGSIDLGISWKGLSFGWSTTVTGERWSRTANTPDYYLKPWTLSEASLQWKIWKVCAGIVVGNLFNQQYQIVQGYPMPGTSVMASLDFTF